MIFCVLFGSLLWGCAAYDPQPLNEDLFRKRAKAQTENGVRFSAAVLGEEETKSVFGLSLYQKAIQPIWLEIENNTRHRMWFPPISVDPDYFSPLEVAYLHHPRHSRAAKQRMDRFFYQQALHGAIDPGAVRSGFIYTNLELGTKAFNVEVLGEDRQVRRVTFLIPVAGLRVDHREMDWGSLNDARETVEVDSHHDFRAVIEALPCCTTSQDGTQMADPVNVVIIGRGADVLYTLLRSGWDETAATSADDPLTRLPWEFRYQPVKPLYFFNRPQDAAFRKSRSTLNERNQLRLWLSPFYFEGNPVWAGQISRIVRRTVWEPFMIEPDVDEARSYLLQNLWYAQSLSKYGYIRKSSVATLSSPRQSLHDDYYFTDGLCLVLWVSDEPVSFSEVQFEPWEKPVVERRRLLLGR